MRYLVGLNTNLKNGHNKPYENVESTPKYLLIDILASMQNCSGVDKIKAYKLSMALQDVVENTFDIEDAEYELALRALDEAKLMAHLHAQMVEFLSGVEKTKPVEPAQVPTEPASQGVQAAAEAGTQVA